ncbi:MAG: ABC transporter ATP-binding protein [Pseudomonadota bacterium]
MTAIVGRSGSGKSTLLHLIAGLDHPSAGSVDVSGVSLSGLSEDRLAKWRGAQVGVVFQFFQLLPTLTILENILLAMDFVGAVAARDRRSRALALLDRVGIADQADKLPGTLSGGQQQRAAIARAIANDPKLLVADEPTGNLDTDSAATVMGLLTALADDGRAVIVVTHDNDVAARADRLIRLSDGMIVEDTLKAAAQ